MLIALIVISFLVFIVALMVMPKRIYEQFQKKEFSGFWKRITLVLADMLLFGISFAAAMAEPGELLFGVSLSLVLLLLFASCFSGAMLLEAFQKKAPKKQKAIIALFTGGFLLAAVLFGMFLLG